MTSEVVGWRANALGVERTSPTEHGVTEAQIKIPTEETTTTKMKVELVEVKAIGIGEPTNNTCRQEVEA